MRRQGTRLEIPVVCIGNLVAGGAGKTPTAMAVAALLKRQGLAPAFVSRGYGRRPSAETLAKRVDPDRDLASEVGDEPLLLARHAPTFVSADRVLAARQAAAEGATVLVMDDGLQNPGLRKDFTIAVVDGERGLGNGLCIPAGPLRAPLASQWPCVSAVCVIGDGPLGAQAAERAHIAAKPVWAAALALDPDAVDRLRGRRVYAFAGIGHPPKFFDSLTRQGLDLAATRAFPDHHPYREVDLAELHRAARRLGAVLVTTEKDRVRLPPDIDVVALPVSLVFADPSTLEAALRTALGSAATAP